MVDLTRDAAKEVRLFGMLHLTRILNFPANWQASFLCLSGEWTILTLSGLCRG
jgi:hypothetical protein